MSEYQKLEISMRYWLLGRRYYKALAAMNFAKKFHTGLRKDKVTPEFQHPLEIAHFLRLFDEDGFEHVLSAAFTHDIREDYDISKEEITTKFGEDTFTLVWYLSKVFRGTKISQTEYYRLMSENKYASLLKGVDRVNNLKSMIGVFSKEKQKEYIQETKDYVLPMLRESRRNFPEIETKIENIKFIICNLITVLEVGLQ